MKTYTVIVNSSLQRSLGVYRCENKQKAKEVAAGLLDIYENDCTIAVYEYDCVREVTLQIA